MILKLQMKILFLVAAILSAAALAPPVERLGGFGCESVLAQEGESDPGSAVRELMGQAKKMGAKGQLPHAWWSLDSRLEEAEKSGATDEEWVALENEAQRLVNAAAFIEKMRTQKSGMEALLGRFDQALEEIGTLYGTQMDPVLSGTDLARDLIDKLSTENLQRQILVDSLTVTNRRFAESTGGRVAAQESLVTALHIEVSSLRRQL